ncbi:hypothetical protein [Actinomadura litoris]|uniref:hypothetical protein n=1 Tax=Actinomadura litoris TaxID=2678616 RepID=UPI001FE4B77E|nr:hypothetical protein [Actinomadura litoris]
MPAAERSAPPASTNTPASAAPCSGPTPPSASGFEIRDNLSARIIEAEREGWLGEVEGLKIGLSGAEEKLAQLNRRPEGRTVVELGVPTLVRSIDDPSPSA